MSVCMYVWSRVPCPVSRVPESVSLGDHTIGGGPGIRSPDSYIYTVYIYIYINKYNSIYIYNEYKYEYEYEYECMNINMNI